MDQNTFFRNPLRAVVYGKQGGQATYVLLGEIPQAIRKSIGKDGQIPANVKDFYGPQYKHRLAIEPIKTVLGGSDLDELLGGSDVDELLGGSEIDDFEELLAETETPKVKQSPDARQETPSSTIFTPIGGPTTTTARGTIYVDFPPVYPEDKFNELKEKIYIATGIPSYRQHLFYINSQGLQQLYRIFLDGAYPVDIRDAFSGSGNKILGLPIDPVLVSRHEHVRVSMLDPLSILDTALDIQHIVYVVDIAEFIDPLVTQLREKIRDTYIINQIYYGFIVKYWPQFSKDAFVMYIASPRELMQVYPELAPDKTTLVSKYRAEAMIIGRKYRNAAKLESWANSHIAVSVVNMTAFMLPITKVMINVRNLFDKLRVSAIIPEIQAWIDLNGSRYILRKRHVKNGSDIGFPTQAAFREGICLAISLRKLDQDRFHEKSTHSTVDNEYSRYLFLAIHADGVYYTKTMWNEEDNLEFEDIVDLVKKFVDPIIRGINGLGRHVFIYGNQLPIITPATLKYDVLSICFYWKKTVNDQLFKLLKSQWAAYLDAKITAPRNVQQTDKYEFLFRKGMFDFDLAHVERVFTVTVIGGENQYAVLTNAHVRQKWEQNFDGRVIKMSLRSSDVKFEITNVRRSEFELFYGFIADFAYNTSQIPEIQTNTLQVISSVDKKLNRLKEQDPELYNLKKHGVNYQYSVKCQKPRQPTVYTPDEMEKMSARDIGRLTKFWNFTLRKPVYYGCPNKHFPHLSFITGVHPKGYCLPCCNKKALVKGATRHDAHNTCLEKFSFTGEKIAATLSHVMAYGKLIDVGRLAKIPYSVLKIFTRPNTDGDFYLVGVPQKTGSIKPAGLWHAAAMGLGITAMEVVDRCAEYFERAPQSVYSFLGGRLLEYFESAARLIEILRGTFSDGQVLSREHQKFARWSELFIELIRAVFGVQIYTTIDESANGQVSFYFSADQIESVDFSNERYMVVHKQINRYYPYAFLNEGEYFKSGKANLIYNGDMQAVVNIKRIIRYSKGKETNYVGKRVDLTLIREVYGTAINAVMVNRQNYAYGVVVSGVYLPVDYSIYLPTEKAIFDWPPPIGTGQQIADIITKINEHIKAKHAVGVTQYAYKLIQPTSRVKFGAKMLGVMADGVLYRCADGWSDLPENDIGYDPDDLNKHILQKTAPTIDKRSTNIGEAMWRNYAYQLFCVEFMAYIENERNTGLRDKIKTLITATNIAASLQKFRDDLAELLNGWQSDLATIHSQMANTYFVTRKKDDFFTVMDISVYDFDRSSMNTLRGLSLDERVKKIIEMAANFTKEDPSFDPRGVNFPNVYLPCEEITKNKEIAYCAGRKLIVHNAEEFAQILAADIGDSLKFRFLANVTWAETIVDPLKFVVVPTEIITIYKVFQ